MKTENMFLFYGFTASPLTENEVMRLKNESFNDDDIYQIGCDMCANQFDCLQEAIDYYHAKSTTI